MPVCESHSLGCQAVESVTPVDRPTLRVPPSPFDGAKAGGEREVAGIRLCWCPPGRFIMGSPRSEPDGIVSNQVTSVMEVCAPGGTTWIHRWSSPIIVSETRVKPSVST